MWMWIFIGFIAFNKILNIIKLFFFKLADEIRYFVNLPAIFRRWLFYIFESDKFNHKVILKTKNQQKCTYHVFLLSLGRDKTSYLPFWLPDRNTIVPLVFPFLLDPSENSFAETRRESRIFLRTNKMETSLTVVLFVPFLKNECTEIARKNYVSLTLSVIEMSRSDRTTPFP